MNKCVLVIGELNVDVIFNQVQGEMTIGKEVIAKDMKITIGSSSAIFACNLASLGVQVSFCGKLGDDYMGTIVLDALKSRTVNVEHIHVSNQWETGVTVALNNGTERAMLTYPGAMLYLKESDVSDEILKNFNHVHISSIFLQEGLKPELIKLLTRAKSLGLTTSVDPQFDPREKWEIDLPELLKYTDIFLPNETESLRLTGLQNRSEVIDYFKQFELMTIVKCGAEGSCLIQDGKSNFLNAFQHENFEDSIGAGDSFDAGFIYGFINHLPIHETHEWASAMGCLNTTKPGGTSAFDIETLSLIKIINKMINGTKG